MCVHTHVNVYDLQASISYLWHMNYIIQKHSPKVHVLKEYRWHHVKNVFSTDHLIPNNDDWETNYLLTMPRP